MVQLAETFKFTSAVYNIICLWMQETSSKCFGSSKTSRISLVDLAGLDRNVNDAQGRQSTREGKNLKKSMSRLGYGRFWNIRVHIC